MKTKVVLFCALLAGLTVIYVKSLRVAPGHPTGPLLAADRKPAAEAGDLPGRGAALPLPSPSPGPTNAAAQSASQVAGAPARFELRPAAPSQWEQPVAEPEFGGFRDWVRRYQAASLEARAALENEGVTLATVRRAALADLIQTDPRRSLELAVPDEVRESLPPAVVPLLEEQVTARGDFEVLAVRQLPGTEHPLPPVVRAATIRGESFEVFTYGRGLTYVTKRDVPLNGIALDAAAARTLPRHGLVPRGKLLALDPTPARILTSRRRAAALSAEPVCSVSGQSTEVAVQVGDEKEIGSIKSFCGMVHAQDWANANLAASGLETPSGGTVIAESTLTEGRKRMLLMRPVWADYTSGMTTNDALTHFQNFSNYMYEMSYGKLVLAPFGKGSDVTPSMTLPGSVVEYDNTGLGKLYNTCLSVAQSSYGYTLSAYDYTYVCTAGRPAADYAGLAFVGGVGFHLANSYWDPATACHEFGHNLGLNHAHFWDTDLKSIIGAGVNVEYGDRNDPMGGGGSPNSYNSRYKNYLGWIEESDIVDLNAAGSGQYRLYAFDLDASSGVRGLKFRRSASQNYWVEFRQRKAGNKALLNGVQLLWTGNANEGSYLLDVRLKGNSDNNAVVVGRTFSDPSLQFNFTPVRLGHTFPESIDVRVNLGPFPANQPPSVVAGVDNANAAVNQALTFTAAATDPNGDELAYSWDFGDGDFSVDNSPVTTHPFAAAGEYAVRCVASDMKGGTGGATVLVRVGSPATFRISGRVFDSQNRPLAGMQVVTDTGRTAMTDPDGSYTLAGLAAGGYAIDAVEPVAGSYVFVHPSFNNPVTVGANVSGIDLIGVPSVQTVATPLVARLAAGWKYLDTGVDQGTGWRAPLFGDSAWATGTAPLGYPTGTPITTLIGFGPNSASKYITYYFRRAFNVANPSSYTSVVLDVLRDDGIVVYVNGTEAYRNNMPAGTITAATLATSRIDAGNYLQATINRGLLVPGNNVIAAEVHQADPTSSDIVFDAAVSGVSVSGVTTLQMLYLSNPADKARFTAPPSLTLNASAFSSAGAYSLVEFFADGGKLGEDSIVPYAFTWITPPEGTHTLTAVGTLPGGGQLVSPPVSITVLPTVTPAVQLTSPAAGATLVTPTNVSLQASVAPAGSVISRVQFFVNDEFIGEALSAPYSLAFAGVTPGVYAIVAVAQTASGGSYTSAPASITLVQPATGAQLVSFGEVWKYLDDGSDPGPGWSGPGFDDRLWAAGPGRLGYGGDGELTIVSAGPATSRHVTTYFRKSFVVTNPAQFGRLWLRLLRDDGAAVYLNGVEVARDNLLSGLLSRNSLAVAAIEGAAESTPVELNPSAGLLVAGTNLLAVEVHQVNIASTDLGFDLALAGLNASMPGATFYLTQPTDHGRYITPANVPLAAYLAGGSAPGSVAYYGDGGFLGAGAGTAPFGLVWSNAPLGSHTVLAVADLGGGQTATSAPVAIAVEPRPATIQPFSTVIIAAGTSWRYWDSLTPVGGGWASTVFDDSAWPLGQARLGWGLDGERTVLTQGRVTTYFRRWFNFPLPAQLSELAFQVVRDDGAAVYFNGVEVFRHNLPPGPLTPATYALTGVQPPDETTYFQTVLPSSGSGLVTGSNLVAVELHQSGPADPDGAFDLQLTLYGTTEARVYLTTPLEGSTYTSGTNVLGLEAIARGAAGSPVTNIEFFADGQKLGERSATPWKLTWNNAPVGPHSLTARSRDATGVAVESPVVSVAVGRTAVATTFIPINSVWRYRDTGTNLGTNWASPTFNDTGWSSGAARLGYGNDGEATVIGFGGNANNKFITTYFRKTIVVTGGAVYTNLNVKLLRDDGAVVWLNGRELFRSNMPTTPITYQTLASISVGGTDEQTFFLTTVGTTNLHTGTNVVGVEMHQAAVDSSDLGFNLELTATGYLDEALPPSLSAVLADGSVEMTWRNTAIGYRVYEAPTLETPPSAWTLTPGSLVELPGRFVFTVPAPAGNRFYRLSKP